MTRREVQAMPVEEHAFDPPDAESLVDPRLPRIIERYARLVGAGVQRPEPHLLVLTLPRDEARHFRGRRTVTVAFSLGALERHAEAEMAVVGSAVVQELLQAVRTRGFRRDFGLLPPDIAPSDVAPELAVSTTGLAVRSTRPYLAVNKFGRLIARVAITSGAVGEERVIASGVFDLASGTSVSGDIARLCTEVEGDRRGQVLFIDARKLGVLVDRTHRELTDGDIARVAATYHAWRGEKEAGVYADVAGFCKSATLEEIRKHGHVLTPGRYVGAEAQEDDGEPFEEKMKRLTATLKAQREEATRLDAAIAENLRALGYAD
ncbi:MAG: N-6 DNA methylase [Gemmatimonadetes bacterium]|nr:N-6 DNA methylase [Gemmatimonadota bacterium]